MHEFYAMQILENKEKTKKPKSNGHKEKQWSTRTKKTKTDQEHRITPITWRGVSNLLLSRGLVKMSTLCRSVGIYSRHNLSFNKIPNEVISNLYVLSLRMLNMVLKYINSTRVITVNNHSILGYPIIS